jgi:hypothetical protein
MRNSKLIRVSEKTHGKLCVLGRYNESMDIIITRLINYMDSHEKPETHIPYKSGKHHKPCKRNKRIKTHAKT